jgi:hypothetical protein
MDLFQNLLYQIRHVSCVAIVSLQFESQSLGNLADEAVPVQSYPADNADNNGDVYTQPPASLDSTYTAPPSQLSQ